METILVVGVDTVVGGNLAARLAETHRVVGIPFGESVTIAGVTMTENDTPAAVVADVQPAWIVHCGGDVASTQGRSAHLNGVGDWSVAARAGHCDFTFVSSDAVFRGPRMFHDTDSDGFADTPRANALRTAEEAARRANREALVVRTNAFGWSPTGTGWLEALRDGSASIDEAAIDQRRHATPLHVSHLVEMLIGFRQAEAKGVVHAGGIERISAADLAERLADALGVSVRTTSSRIADGLGETSLRTTITTAIDGLLPMIGDGIAALLDEAENGFVEHLTGRALTPQELVA